MANCGDADRPPVRPSVPQAWCHAGAAAVAGRAGGPGRAGPLGTGPAGRRRRCSRPTRWPPSPRLLAPRLPLADPAPHHRRADHRQGRLPRPVPGRRRLGDDHPRLRRRGRALHAAAHGVGARGGPLRRGPGGQGLDPLRAAAQRGPGAARGVGAGEGRGRIADPLQDQGRAAGGRHRAPAGDGADLDGGRRARQPPARGPRLLGRRRGCPPARPVRAGRGRQPPPPPCRARAWRRHRLRAGRATPLAPARAAANRRRIGAANRRTGRSESTSNRRRRWPG